MKIVRFTHKKTEFSLYGVVKDGIVYEIKGDVFGDFSVTNTEFSISEINILSPCEPSKIVAVGLNYKDHAREMGKEIPKEPLLFMKPSTSVLAHEGVIPYPSHMSKRVDYEAELAVVISKKAQRVKVEDAQNYILGYTCFNDVTARDLQARDGQFTRAKGFDGFAPLGPFIETEIDPRALDIRCYLNGEVKQLSNTKNMIFSVPYLLSFISSVMTLLPGDVVATGTPSGVGPMNPGDRVEVEIEGIGVLKNSVGG